MSDVTTAQQPEPPAEAPEAVSEPPNASERTSEADRPEGERREGEHEIERGEDGRILSREAATYRRRLRDTESERDQLREQLDRLQRAEVERLASANGLAVPADVWPFGASLETCATRTGPSTPRPSTDSSAT